MIEDDMEQLRALFYATGEGLLKDAINQSLARVFSLLDIMRMDTGTLIARYQVMTAPPCRARCLEASCCGGRSGSVDLHAHTHKMD